jgi:hypothetical protein
VKKNTHILTTPIPTARAPDADNTVAALLCAHHALGPRQKRRQHAPGARRRGVAGVAPGPAEGVGRRRRVRGECRCEQGAGGHRR